MRADSGPDARIANAIYLWQHAGIIFNQLCVRWTVLSTLLFSPAKEIKMKKTAAALVFSFTVVPVFAQKPCEELRSEIAARLEAKGVKNFRLDAIRTEQVKNEKIVGTCESGMKKSSTPSPESLLICLISSPVC